MNNQFERHMKRLIARPIIRFIPKAKSLVIVTFHNIEAKHHQWFCDVMDLVNSEYEFCSIDDFLGSKRDIDQDKLRVLITFDDGFYSNRIVAEKYLARYSAKALFFLTEKFIGLNVDESFNFAKTNFYSNSKISTNEKESFRSMSWGDVGWLLNQGHHVGAHSANHIKLIDSETDSDLHEEILNSAERLEKRLGSRISTFAFPFGGCSDIGLRALSLTKDRFAHTFSNIRGSVADSPGRHFLFRQNLVPGDPLWLVRAMIEGRMDWKYRRARLSAHHRFS